MQYDNQIRLKHLRMKQRELWQEVRKNGFSKLSESLFSNMILGNYTGTTYSELVLNTADAILKKKEKGASK